MNKLLRYSFIAVMALVSSLSFGATVIFTAGTDKGTQEKADVAGDQVTKDGITIKTTKGISAFAAAQYRFAKGSTTTFSSTVGNITKVEITSTAQGTKNTAPAVLLLQAQAATPTPTLSAHGLATLLRSR